jgi:hypothetical protein
MFGPYVAPSPQPPMHRWQGASGEWHYFDIYPITAIPSWIAECNYIFARPRFDLAQSREPFYFGESGDFNKELANHPKLEPAKRLGATEVHIRFWAKSRSERLDVETDLRRAHWTPLNYQPTPAPAPGLGALAAFGFGGGLGAALDTRTPLDQWLTSLAPAPPPKNALANLASLAPLGLGGFPSPFGTDLDWLLRQR